MSIWSVEQGCLSEGVFSPGEGRGVGDYGAELLGLLGEPHRGLDVALVDVR